MHLIGIWIIQLMQILSLCLFITHIYIYIFFFVKRLSKTILKTHLYHPSDLLGSTGTIYVSLWRLQTRGILSPRCCTPRHHYIQESFASIFSNTRN